MTIVTLPPEIWHRIEDRTYSSIPDEYDRWYPITKVEHRKFEVLKHTSKGVWLREHPMVMPKFVLRDARKRFACPTIEEALESFIARKTKQASIYRNRMVKAEWCIAEATRKFSSRKKEIA